MTDERLSEMEDGVSICDPEVHTSIMILLTV
jgi:hypothetical protein